MPLLEVNGSRLVQSQAVARYAARKGNLLGNNDEEAARYLIDFSRDLVHLTNH